MLFQGTLKVYVHSPGDSNLGSPLWSATTDQGNRWYLAAVNVSSGSPSTYWEAVFEMTLGPTYLSDAAIDDIVIDDQPCLPLG